MSYSIQSRFTNPSKYNTLPTGSLFIAQNPVPNGIVSADHKADSPSIHIPSYADPVPLSYSQFFS